MFKPAPLATAAALLLASSAHAQDRTAQVDSLFGFATAATPGCAVGVAQHGKVVVNRAYGLADVERATPLGPGTRFDIGSTHKQFVAAAVLHLVEDGRLSLADDIRKHVPELPDYGHRITIDHLLTHRSGIRDWTGLLPLAPEGTEVLALIVRQRGLNFTPGDQWAYSNSGYVLLKEIVARASGMSFADFARTRLFAPLGMTSSAYVPDVLQAGGSTALGYQKDGTGWRPFMRLGNNRGGGTIVSTAGDLLTWNEALTSGRLGTFVTAKLHEPARLNSGRALQYARGLNVEKTPGGVVVSHSGGAAGFSTWLGRVPEHALSVVVMCNFDPVSATALAARTADLFLPPMAASPAPTSSSASTSSAAVDVGSRAGLFFDERTGEPMRLLTNGGRIRIANGPALVAVAQDRFRAARPDLFFRSQDEFELAFLSPDQLELKSMEGEATRYRRARPWTPTPEELQGVEGRYESKELGTVVELVPGTNALVMRTEQSPERAVTLAPVDRDTYMVSMMIVRLRRDASGKVAGIEYGNPLVRSIGFTRLGDRAATAASLAPPSAAPAATPAATPAAPAAVASPAPRLEGLTGAYEIAPGRLVTITLENAQLYGQPPADEKFALVHASGTTFRVGEGDASLTLTFVLGADGRATSMVMRQRGRERTLAKVR